MNARFLERLKIDYPEFRFKDGKKFAFRPPCTIVIGPEEPSDSLLLLHELGHAILKHYSFETDAKRVKMEREAWDQARELCLKYEILYDEDVVEREMDTYRDYLDKKSRCPKCGLTRFQTPDGAFHCPQCDVY